MPLARLLQKGHAAILTGLRPVTPRLGAKRRDEFARGDPAKRVHLALVIGQRVVGLRGGARLVYGGAVERARRLLFRVVIPGSFGEGAQRGSEYVRANDAADGDAV